MRERAPLVALACAAMPLAIGLGRWSLFDPDEGRNAEIAREMLVGARDWIVPHLNGAPFLDKPPMLFWTVAAAFRLFGVHEWVARIPSVLAAVATMACTWALGRRLLGDRRAVTAAVVFATCPMVLVFGRLVIFDMPLTAFMTASLYALVRARCDGDPWRWLPLAGLAWGGALLTKGPVGMALPLVVWLAARGALPKTSAPRARSAFVAAVAIGVLVLGVWVAAVLPSEPGFLRYAVVDETFLRVTSTKRFHRGAAPYYYLVTLPWALGLWSVLLAVVGPTLVRRARAGGRDAETIRFASRAVGAIVVFFTLSASKRPQYVLPALVPLALLVAAGVEARPRLVARVLRGFGWIAAVAGSVSLALVALGVVTTSNRTDLPVPAMAGFIGAALVPWGLATAMARRPRRALVCAAVFGPLVFLASLRPLGVYAERRSARRLVASVPADAPVVCFTMFRPSLPFYLGRLVTVVSDRGGVLTSNYVASRRAALDVPTLRSERSLADVLAAAPITYVVITNGREDRLRHLAPGVELTVVGRDRRSTLLRASVRSAGGRG